MKQNGAIQAIRWRPGNKGLVADIDPKDVQNGGLYVTTAESGALNVRSVGAGTNISPDYEQILGNSLLATLDPVTVQVKAFRISVDISLKTIDSTLGFKIGTPDGLQSTTASVTILAADNLATTLGKIKTAVDLMGFTPTSATTSTGTYTGYIDFSFASPVYIDFILYDFVVTGNMTASYEVTQEAIDEGMTGEWNMIGSASQTGDTFLFFTTKRGDTKSVVVSNCVNSAGLIQVTTATDHNLTTNEIVTISGVEGTVEANGIWSVTVIDATNITLQLSAFVNAYTSGGILQYQVVGYGEWGVVYRTSPSQITYTRLLRSREFNFSTFYQIYAESKYKNDGRKAVYFTDNNNPYRVAFYKGDYIQDGALTTVSPDGQYTYGTIATDIRLVPEIEGIKIRFVTQLQSGGAVRSGNKRYAVRFLTESFAPTGWTELTNPIPVYSYNNQSGVFPIGDEENIITPKINVLEITNPYGNVYTYCDIALVEYVGIAVQGSIIGRYTLNGNPTQIINHTGNEVDTVDLDVGTLAQIENVVEKGRNLTLLDNRLVISDLTPFTFPDFTDFTKTWRYSIEVEQLDPVGNRTLTPTVDMQVGEYQLPNNYYSKLSHMRYETYRYGVRYRMRDSGLWTPVFYVGYDIRIDLTTPFPSQRDAGSFLTYDLTDEYTGTFTNQVNSIYIDFHGIDYDYEIDGVPFKELVSEVQFVRARVVPTILASGMAVMGVTGQSLGGFMSTFRLTYDFASTTPVGPFPFSSGTDWFSTAVMLSIGADNPPYPNWTLTLTGALDRKVSFLYAPDILLANTTIQFIPGDKIINFGNPKPKYVSPFYVTGRLWGEYYREFDGHTGHTDDTTIEILDINDSQFLTHGTLNSLIGSKNLSSSLKWSNSIAGTPAERYSQWDSQASVTLVDATDVNQGGNTDYGFYDMLYYRPITDQYGSPEDNVFETTGVTFQINVGATGTLAVGSISVFGDVCTQMFYLKHRYPYDPISGFGGGLGFYTQNRVNAQMVRKPTPTSPDIFPEQNNGDWLTAFEAIDPRLNYNAGYTYQNNVTSSRGFDSNANYQKDWGNAIMWSDPEAEGSNSDNLRVIPPFNIKFLDYSSGRITDALNVNGELITVQHREVQRQYFNSTAIINTGDGSPAILGSSAVLSRRGSVMTKMGSQHKWSIMRGRSERGFDVLYFVDWLNKAVCRLGYNGNDTLETINGMKSFFANNLKWVWNEDRPANGLGICSVFDQRYREAMWTFRGFNPDIPQWSEDSLYEEGAVVSYGTHSWYSDIPNFYTATVESEGVLPTDTDYWTQVPYTDANYYNLYTIAFSELKNEFQLFLTPKPLIYAQFEDGYLVPRPISNTGQIYLSDSGERLAWFNDGSTVMTDNAYFDAVINYPQGRKKFTALSIESDIAPTSIICTTPTFSSVTPNPDAVQREGNEWVVPIRKATVTLGSSILWGDWAKFRFVMSNAAYNKINSFACKLRASIARQTDS
mgnify:FL=1